MSAPPPPKPAPEPEKVERSGDCQCDGRGPDFTYVFDTVAPSVVSVLAGHVEETGFATVRQGSGFLWDAQGHLVTNDHIVDNVSAFQVRTADRQVLSAVLVGSDPKTDLAVLKLDGGRLPPLARGSVKPLRPGQWVAALGSPYGFDHSITVGVVSALGRRNLPSGAPRYANFIQTDASINPGNSGGPLVNIDGRVVGVNTAVLGHGQGVSFATPIDMVNVVVESILADGRFVRGYTGLVTISPSLDQVAASGLSTRRGALVKGVVLEAPGHLAGLEPGDIILAYDGVPIEDPRMLSWLIAATKPGRAAQVRVARGRDRLNFMVVVGSAQE
ncbi:MAG: S1C family serine protease [Bradymonadia bacterium]